MGLRACHDLYPVYSGWPLGLGGFDLFFPTFLSNLCHVLLLCWCVNVLLFGCYFYPPLDWFLRDRSPLNRCFLDQRPLNLCMVGYCHISRKIWCGFASRITVVVGCFVVITKSSPLPSETSHTRHHLRLSCVVVLQEATLQILLAHRPMPRVRRVSSMGCKGRRGALGRARGTCHRVMTMARINFVFISCW